MSTMNDRYYLEQEKLRLENFLKQGDQILSAKEKALNEKAARIRTNQVQNNSAMDLDRNFKANLPRGLVPGNVGDINRVIWPFYFNTPIEPIGIQPNGTYQTSITISQEAGFIWTQFSKAVYVHEGDVYRYIDPDDVVSGEAQGLRVSFRNAQAQMTLFNSPVNIDQVGNPRWPTVLDSPFYIQPNAIFEVLFTNNNSSVVYVPSISFFGYRLRSEESMNALSNIYG